MQMYKKQSPMKDIELDKPLILAEEIPWKVNQPTDLSAFLAKGGVVRKLAKGESANLEMNFNPYPWVLSEDNPARQVGFLRTLK